MTVKLVDRYHEYCYMDDGVMLIEYTYKTGSYLPLPWIIPETATASVVMGDWFNRTHGIRTRKLANGEYVYACNNTHSLDYQMRAVLLVLPY